MDLLSVASFPPLSSISICVLAITLLNVERHKKCPKMDLAPRVIQSHQWKK